MIETALRTSCGEMFDRQPDEAKPSAAAQAGMTQQVPTGFSP
jgi:hypothetical protein